MTLTGLFEEMQSALASLLVHEPSKKRHSPGSLLADELLRLAAALLPHPAADRAVFERYLEGAESPTRKMRARTCVKKIASV